MVVSLLHQFLTHYAMGDVQLQLHADNCIGQNKNNTLLQVQTTIHVHLHTATFPCTHSYQYMYDIFKMQWLPAFFSLQYLAWWVLVVLHCSMTMLFLLVHVGHSKFIPDWCFGLLKQWYRRTYSSSHEKVPVPFAFNAVCVYVQLRLRWRNVCVVFLLRSVALPFHCICVCVPLRLRSDVFVFRCVSF